MDHLSVTQSPARPAYPTPEPEAQTQSQHKDPVNTQPSARGAYLPTPEPEREPQGKIQIVTEAQPSTQTAHIPTPKPSPQPTKLSGSNYEPPQVTDETDDPRPTIETPEADRILNSSSANDILGVDAKLQDGKSAGKVFEKGLSNCSDKLCGEMHANADKVWLAWNKLETAAKQIKCIKQSSIKIVEARLFEASDPDSGADEASEAGAEVDNDGNTTMGGTMRPLYVDDCYSRASPILKFLRESPHSEEALNNLKQVNEDIRKENVVHEADDPLKWFIEIDKIIVYYVKANGLQIDLKEKPTEEKKNNYQRFYSTMQKFIQENDYRPDWAIDPLDVPPPAMNPDLASGASLFVPNGPQIQTEPPTVDSPTTVSVPGTVQRLREETLQAWKAKGWTYHAMTNGDIILSHKPLSRLGNVYGYEFTLMTKHAPYFVVKTGSEIGGEQTDYLKKEGTYKIITDPGSEEFQGPWTWRHRRNHARLLWAAIKPRKQSTLKDKLRSAEVQCCVQWKDNTVTQMSRANYAKVCPTNEKREIEQYCTSVGIECPWNMKPRDWIVPVASGLGQKIFGNLHNHTESVEKQSPSGNAVASLESEPVADLQRQVDNLKLQLETLSAKATKTEETSETLLAMMKQVLAAVGAPAEMPARM